MAEKDLTKERRNSKKSKPTEQKSETLCHECNELCNEDDRQTINCDLCKKWYHKGCTNIKKPLNGKY